MIQDPDSPPGTPPLPPFRFSSSRTEESLDQLVLGFGNPSQGQHALGTHPKPSWWWTLAYGQLLSLLIATTGACSSLLAQSFAIAAPATQNLPNYLLLSLFLLWPSPPSVLVPRGGRPLGGSDGTVKSNGLAGSSDSLLSSLTTSTHDLDARRTPHQASWWKFFVLSVIDVEANVLVVWAFQYTSITSITLLDCFTIPSVIVLSFCLLGTRYSLRKLGGALLCLLGLGVVVLSDTLGNQDDDHFPHAFKGDVLCIVGAFCYACSNVTQEAWVRDQGGPPRFLGRLGACGAIVSFLQAVLVERHAVAQAHWTAGAIGAWVAFTLALSSAYALTSWFLVTADAALFNLGLLTSDVYAVLFSVLAIHRMVSWLYAVAFLLTLTGLVIYHRPTKDPDETTPAAVGPEGQPSPLLFVGEEAAVDARAV